MCVTFMSLVYCQVFCKEKVMCTHPIFLRFLGFNGDADVIYLRKRAEYIKATQSINVRVFIMFLHLSVINGIGSK